MEDQEEVKTTEFTVEDGIIYEAETIKKPVMSKEQRLFAIEDEIASKTAEKEFIETTLIELNKKREALIDCPEPEQE